jgi:NAD+ diphosphatase
LLVLVRGMEILVEGTDDGPRLPEHPDLSSLGGPQVYLGQLADRSCFAAPLLNGVALPANLRLRAGRQIATAVPQGLAATLGQAIALVEWDTMHRYCGGCAVVTETVPNERAKRCPRCSAHFYPRISPAVIVLVARDRECLLARNAAFPARWFSILAGFVEAGESLEQAAIREVREEVGLEIADLRYFGSQPWPFGRSLMVGFYARHVGGDIRIDGVEITEAGWFEVDRLPDLPSQLSIARKMIDRFVADVRGG